MRVRPATPRAATLFLTASLSAALSIAATPAATPAAAEGWVTGSLGVEPDLTRCLDRLERTFDVVKAELGAGDVLRFGDSVAIYDVGDAFTDAAGRCWLADGAYTALLFVHDSDRVNFRNTVFDVAQDAWNAR